MKIKQETAKKLIKTVLLVEYAALLVFTLYRERKTHQSYMNLSNLYHEMSRDYTEDMASAHAVIRGYRDPSKTYEEHRSQVLSEIALGTEIDKLFLEGQFE